VDHDPLQLSKFHFDTSSILDACYKQVLSEPSTALFMIPIALDFVTGSRPKTLSKIGRICNIADPQLVKRCLQEHSSLFYARIERAGMEKCVLSYQVPNELRNFFLDPGRSQHLYSAPRIIGKCWYAIKMALDMCPGTDDVWSFTPADCLAFFTPKQGSRISSATLMLSESVKNAYDSDTLLRFLKFLSRIPWVDVSFRGYIDEAYTVAIARWVCTTLVS